MTRRVALSGTSLVTAALLAVLAYGRTPVGGNGAESIRLAGLQVSVWRPAGTTVRPAPLVVFSHGFHGSSTQSAFLMKGLAAGGYLVMAPDHADSLRRGVARSVRPPTGFANARAWTAAAFRDRADDVMSLLVALKSQASWSGAIDWSRVALIGHSLGGYTVLVLAGAWPSWPHPTVKAVIALSPYCAPFVEQHTLAGIRVPVMYQGGTRDLGITPFVRRPGGAYDQTRPPALFVEFQGAGHFAWTDLNPRYQASVASYCRAFLDRHVKGDRSADPSRRLPDVADLRSK